MSSRLHIALPLISLFVLAPSIGHATLDEARESLLQRSPFVKWAPPRPDPPKIEAPVVETGALSRELQFNGIMQIGEETYFNIFDKIENKSILLGVNENRGARFQVVEYNNSGDRSITVQAGGSGRREKIYLATSDGVSIPTATPAPNTNVDARLRPSANQPNVTSRTTPPSSERRRRVIPRRISNEN